MPRCMFTSPPCSASCKNVSATCSGGYDCGLATYALSSSAVRAAASVSPRTMMLSSSMQSVTLPLRANASSVDIGNWLTFSAWTGSSVQISSNSSISLLAMSMPSGTPKSRTSQRERSMWTRHPLCCCSRAMVAFDVPGCCIVRVRISSAQTATATDFRCPDMQAICRSAALMLASDPLVRSTQRRRSIFIVTWQRASMSRRRRRLRRHSALRTSASSSVSSIIGTPSLSGTSRPMPMGRSWRLSCGR
mmetsp:Transcript_67335/g.130118  ORF Transcript_67335/g.130118 Transcript_67335/m.130118 type:complete len:248 (-) Transcript_67335:123-866(-)